MAICSDCIEVVVPPKLFHVTPVSFPESELKLNPNKLASIEQDEENL